MASFNSKFANNPSPYKLVLSEEESYYQNHYFKLAMEVAKYDLTYESFGLTLIDLLQFDIPTFKLIRTAVEDKVAERAKHMKPLIEATKHNKGGNSTPAFGPPTR